MSFKDAIIAPGKADGTSWDETYTIPSGVLSQVGTALTSGDPIGGTLAVLAGPTLNAAISATAKPDAYGWISGTAFGVTGDSYYLAQGGDAIEDSFTPVWPNGGLSYQNVPIDSDVRFDMTVMDADLIDDDPIGTAEINSSDLKDALTAQQKFYVRVDDQTDHQLLFLGITVVEQWGPL